jgi:hypothetical protein
MISSYGQKYERCAALSPITRSGYTLADGMQAVFFHTISAICPFLNKKKAPV